MLKHQNTSSRLQKKLQITYGIRFFKKIPSKVELAPSHKLLTLLRVLTSAGNLLQDQLPGECDYLLRALEFMAIILTLEQSDKTVTIIQSRHLFANTTAPSKE